MSQVPRSALPASETAMPIGPETPRPIRQMKAGCIAIPSILLLLLGVSILRIRAAATADLSVPDGDVLLVHESASDDSPLIARLGEGREARIRSRSEDWRWLEVEVWGSRRGYARRPLDLMPWNLRAEGRFESPAEADLRAPDDAPGARGEAAAQRIEDRVTIPAGSFVMGDVTGQGGADERPAHPVRLRAYAIDRFEVSIADYWACVIAEACAAPTTDGIAGRPHFLADPAFDAFPMVMVSWSEAKRYCNWRGGRLPTEAEWERAAGWDAEAGVPRIWPWGYEPIEGAANLGAGAEDGPALRGSHPRDEAASGAMDMAGNVREWVLDWYKEDAYETADASDPRGPSARRGAGSGRVVRGGSYAEDLEAGRVARRGHALPEYGYADVGFRCAWDERRSVD